jgi:ATP-independent RNA helicase DbpA
LPKPHQPPLPPTVTLLLGAGKKKKLRPGDVLGALTAQGGVDAADVGTIQIDDTYAYVAVSQKSAERALAVLSKGPVKGRQVKVRKAGLSFREPQ